MVVKIPEFDPIAYLVGRKFPDAKPFRHMARGRKSKIFTLALREQLEKAEAYRQEPTLLAAEELSDLCQAENAKQQEELRLQSDRAEQVSTPA